MPKKNPDSNQRSVADFFSKGDKKVDNNDGEESETNANQEQIDGIEEMASIEPIASTSGANGLCFVYFYVNCD